MEIAADHFSLHRALSLVLAVVAVPSDDRSERLRACAEVRPPGVVLEPDERSVRRINQQIAHELSQEQRITLLCGHYEGIDERIHKHLVTDEISIGDYILTGGELAAMIVVDAVSRLIPEVLAGESTQEESYTNGLLEYPHYTRPPEFRGWRVPDVLLSGNHAEIAKWRKEQAIKRTRDNRPDLLR